MGEKLNKKKRFELPDAYVLLFGLALIIALLSYVIPAGEYVRVVDEATGRTVVDPTSFHYLDEKSPIGFFGFFGFGTDFFTLGLTVFSIGADGDKSCKRPLYFAISPFQKSSFLRTPFSRYAVQVLIIPSNADTFC